MAKHDVRMVQDVRDIGKVDVVFEVSIDGAKRGEEGLATYKQMRLLMRFGYDTNGMTREVASKLIEQLKANGWQRLDQPPDGS